MVSPGTWANRLVLRIRRQNAIKFFMGFGFRVFLETYKGRFIIQCIDRNYLTPGSFSFFADASSLYFSDIINVGGST